MRPVLALYDLPFALNFTVKFGVTELYLYVSILLDITVAILI